MNILQIGCNIGKDHVDDFCKKHQTIIDKIIFVDANKKALEKAKENYAYLDNAVFWHYGVVNTYSKTVDLYTPSEEETSGQSSLDVNHTKTHKQIEFNNGCHDKMQDMVKHIVPAKHINELLEETGFDYIDRLYIDVEGFDAKLVTAIDLKKFFIQYIRWEFKHSDGPFKQGINLRMAVENLDKNDYFVLQDGEYDLACFKK